MKRSQQVTLGLITLGATLTLWRQLSHRYDHSLDGSRPSWKVALDAKTIESMQEVAIHAKGGGFSVMTPVPLTEKIGDEELPQVGKVAVHSFLGSQDIDVFAVAYYDLPGKFVKPSEVEKRLDAIGKDQADIFKGKVVEQLNVSLGRYHGREIAIDLEPDTTYLAERTGALVVRSRIYIVGKRVYQISVTAPRYEQRSNQQIGTFLESFRLIS